MRAKTLFGEKFVDIVPGQQEGSTNLADFYSTKGELLDRCNKDEQPDHTLARSLDDRRRYTAEHPGHAQALKRRNPIAADAIA